MFSACIKQRLRLPVCEPCSALCVCCRLLCSVETWLIRNRYLIVAAFRGISATNKRSTARKAQEYVRNLLTEIDFLNRLISQSKTTTQHTIINNTVVLRFVHAPREQRPQHHTIEIWLILPVVICLFQGLSHACLRITALQESAHGSLHQT